MKVKKNVEPWRLAYVKNGPRSLPSEFGQNHVSNSWDIPDMDKYYQAKFCLDKCHHDSQNLCMSSLQSESVQNGSRNLSLNFGQDQVSSRRDNVYNVFAVVGGSV